MAEYIIGNVMGPQGPKGDKGDTGPQGPRGIQGEQGPPVDTSTLVSKSMIGASGGVAGTSHTSTSTTYGAATYSYYGHMRFAGNGSSTYYALPVYYTASTLSTLNTTTYMYAGVFFAPISSLTAGTTGVEGLTSTSVRATIISLTPGAVTGTPTSGTGVEQILSIPKHGKTYHRYCRVTSTEYGTWFPMLDGADLGVAGGIATLNAAGKLAQMPTAADVGAVADSFRAKLLWSGSWSSGSITVPDFDKYRLFQIGLEGAGAPIITAKHGTYLRGIGGFTTEAPTIITYHLGITFSGNTLTWVACNGFSHVPSGSHGSISSNGISGITGII